MRRARIQRCATPSVLLPIYGVNHGGRMTEKFYFQGCIYFIGRSYSDPGFYLFKPDE